MEVPELLNVSKLLNTYKYRHIDDFNEQQREKICGLLSNVRINDIDIYVKVYSAFVETKDQDTDELLWDTRIMFASFIFIDKKTKEMVDNFFVPVRPFRIRTSYESYEMDKLIHNIFDEVLKIKADFGINETEDDNMFAKPGRA